MSILKLKNTSGGSLSLSSTDSAADSTLSIPSFSGSLVAADISGNVGLGTTTAIAGTKLHIVEGAVVLAAYSAEAGFLTRKANGTEAVPTATTINQRSTILVGSSYGGSTWVNNTGICFYASENQSETARGSHITFETAGIGGTSRSEKMRLDSAGRLGINTSSPNVLLDISSGTPNTVGDPITIGQVNIAGPDTGAAYAGNLNISSTDTAAANLGGSIYFGGKWSGTAQAKWAFVKGACTTTGQYGGYLIFGTRADGGALTEKMRIAGSGAVTMTSTLTCSEITIKTAGIEGGQLNLSNPDGTTTGGVLDVSSANNVRLFNTANNGGFQIGQLGGTGGVINLYTEGVSRLSIAAAGGVYIPGALTVSDNIVMTNSAPTIHMVDTDHNTAFLHCNSNTFYILRGATNTNSWIAVGSYWPLQVNLTNNDATFGGAIWAAGNITAYSDEKLKKDWEDVPNNLIENLAKVKSGTFTRIDLAEENQRQIGVSAQSLQKVMPEAVTDNNGILSVTYGNAALVACVELAKEIQILKEEIRLLKESK